MKKTKKSPKTTSEAALKLAKDKARAKGRAKAGLNAASGVRAFATTKYPTFGKGVYSEQSPPASVTSSPFYWWYKFLLLNEDYKKALTSKKTTGIDRQVVKDFGNVHNVDFKTWWNAHVHLFAEPLADYKMYIAEDASEIAPFSNTDVINLVVPLTWSNVGIKRRFAQIIDKLVEKTPRGVRVEKFSGATYKLSRKWSIIGFENDYEIYTLKKANELEVQNGGKKLAWADIMQQSNVKWARDYVAGKIDIGEIEFRRVATTLAIRHYERAKQYIKAAATNSFP